MCLRFNMEIRILFHRFIYKTNSSKRQGVTIMFIIVSNVSNITVYYLSIFNFNYIFYESNIKLCSKNIQFQSKSVFII